MFFSELVHNLQNPWCDYAIYEVRNDDPLSDWCQFLKLRDYLIFHFYIQIVFFKPADSEQLLVFHNVSLLECGRS